MKIENNVKDNISFSTKLIHISLSNCWERGQNVTRHANVTAMKNDEREAMTPPHNGSLGQVI